MLGRINFLSDSPAIYPDLTAGGPMNQKIKPIVTAALLVFVMLPVLPVLAQRQYDTDILKDTFAFDDSTPRSVDFDKLVQACPVRDCIRSIDNPRFVTSDQAGFLNADDLILGVVIGGDVRAYPAKILDHHEIVNDTVGGKPIAITYCPLCGSGVAVSRVIGGVVTEFGVSGVLYNSDLVIYDRASNTLWSQIEGAGVVGPNTGKKLQTLPVTMTRWSRWQKNIPAAKYCRPIPGSMKTIRWTVSLSIERGRGFTCRFLTRMTAYIQKPSCSVPASAASRSQLPRRHSKTPAGLKPVWRAGI